MSTKYPQGMITGTPPYAQGNFSGVWTLEQLAKNYYFYGDSIANSLRFRSSASAYLNRTFSSSASNTKFTYSFWYKPGLVTVNAYALEGYVSDSDRDAITFNNNNLNVSLYQGSTLLASLVTTAVFRDPSAWYHFVVAYDSTQATASNRILVYVNGSQITAFSTASYPPQNQATYLNSNVVHNIGRSSYNGGASTGTYMDGYMADINFIDGQALDPSYFGVTATATGVWSPKKYTGTYGTNGFHLNFSNGTSTTTLGYDSSGNSNNWTTNNISLTAGSTYDWMTDSPTSFAGSSYGVGNYAVLNAVSVGVDCTLSNGNLGIAYGSSGTRYCTMGTIGMSSGKWYCEFAYTGGTTPSPIIGLSAKASSTDMIYYPGYTTSGWGYENSGLKYTNAISTSYGSTWTANDVIGIAFDADGGALTFYVNGASQGVAYTGLTSGPYYFAVGDGGGLSTYNGWINFGQRPFAYTPPSGYKSLCTYNLPTPSILAGNKYMDATIWSGDGSASRAITNSGGMQPDFTWIKCRNSAQTHVLQDVIRGATLPATLASNSTAAEGGINAQDYGGVTAFNSNGFTVGQGSQGGGNAAYVNYSGFTYVGWQWKAGGTAVTNTAGSITSSVSANTTAGFSVVTYTGNGTTGTYGHGLGIAPSMVIAKRRDTGSSNWVVYAVGAWSAGNYLILNATDAVSSVNAVNTFGNNSVQVQPSSTVVTIGSGTNMNASGGTYVAYCFAAIPGYSAFGSYTGNGSADGPFVYCGFRPRFIMVKGSTVAGTYWAMYDTSRNTYNVMNSALAAQAADAEYSYVSFDAVSNGFKVRNTGGDVNTNGATYIYAAFAENPFNYSLAR